MRVERCQRAFGFVGCDRAQRRNAKPPACEQHVFRGIGACLLLDLGQPLREQCPSLRQPRSGGIADLHGQRSRRTHRGKDRCGNELLLDRTVASATLDPHVSGMQPVPQFGQYTEVEGPAIEAGTVDPSSPRRPNEAERYVDRQLAQPAAAEITQYGDGAGKRRAGRDGAEGESRDERGPDLPQDGRVRRSPNRPSR